MNTSPLLVRTLSDQHWYNAAIAMFSSDVYEFEAGRQGNWEFKVKRIRGHPTLFTAITYHNGEEKSRTKLDVWKYMCSNPNTSWVTYL